MVTRLDLADAGTDLFHDASTFVPDDHGKANGAAPVAKCQSEWHSPVATSLTSTSPSFGSSTSISSMENERVGPYKTAARDFIEHPLYLDLAMNLC